MTIFSSHQRLKIFQQRWKLDGRKKCHYWILTSMNILSVAFFCNTTSNGADRLSISGPAPAGREMCVQCLSESAAAGNVPLLGQSFHSSHCGTAKSALLQALCWKSSLVNGKLSSGMWLWTQITLFCPWYLQGTLFSEAFSLSLFAQVALPALPALGMALPLQPERSGAQALNQHSNKL